MNKTIEVIIIEDSLQVVHRSISTVYADSNPYNVAIQAIVEQLTGTKPTTKVQAGAVPLNKDKFAQAVPDYKPITGSSNGRTTDFESVNLGSIPSPVANTEFHPDLIKEGVAPKAIKTIEQGIPTVKIDMKSVFKSKGV